HILNAQVAIRARVVLQALVRLRRVPRGRAGAPACQGRRDGKKCKKAFRKDMAVYEESAEYCPHCDNHYVLDVKTRVVKLEGEDLSRPPADCARL
ncbi:hypothetical protein B0H17DRAFT_1092523, partial [Mycena rosella]